MTVSDLIAKLQEYPPDAKVLAEYIIPRNDGDDYDSVGEVSRVDELWEGPRGSSPCLVIE